MEVNEEQLPSPEPQHISTFEDYLPKQPPPKAYVMPYLGQFGLLLGLIGGGLIVAAILSILSIFLLGGNLSTLDKANLFKPENATINKTLQIVGTVCMFFLPPFFFALIAHKKPLTYLGFNKKISWQQIGLVIVIAFTGLFLSGALAEINELIPISKGLRTYFKKLEDNYAEEMMAMVQMKTLADYLVSMVLIALAPAIVEEVFFRAGVQQLFTNWFQKPWLAILVTSILFSAVHMSYFGFLPRAMLGAVLGLLFYYSKNIWTNILMHFLNNGIAVTQLYYISTKGKLDKKALDAMDEHFPIWLGAIALVAMIMWLYFFKRESDKTLKNNTIVDAANTFA